MCVCFFFKCFITICQYWTTGASYETQCFHCQSICVHSCGPFITSLFYLIVSSRHISLFLFYSPMNQSCERCGKVLHNSRCIDPFAFYAIHSTPLLSHTKWWYGSFLRFSIFPKKTSILRLEELGICQPYTPELLSQSRFISLSYTQYLFGPPKYL